MLLLHKVSRDARKPVFGVFDPVWHKLACTFSEESFGHPCSEADLRLCFRTYAKIRFSHGAAQVVSLALLEEKKNVANHGSVTQVSLTYLSLTP